MEDDSLSDWDFQNKYRSWWPLLKVQDDYLRENTCVSVLNMEKWRQYTWNENMSTNWYTEGHYGYDSQSGLGKIVVRDTNGGCNSHVGHQYPETNYINFQYPFYPNYNSPLLTDRPLCMNTWFSQLLKSIGYNPEKPDHDSQYLRLNWQWHDFYTDSWKRPARPFPESPANQASPSSSPWKNEHSPWPVSQLDTLAIQAYGNYKVGDRWGRNIAALNDNTQKWHLTQADKYNINQAYQCLDISFPRNMPVFFYSLSDVCKLSGSMVWQNGQMVYPCREHLNFTAILDNQDRFHLIEENLMHPSTFNTAIDPWNNNDPEKYPIIPERIGIVYPKDSHSRTDDMPFAIARLASRRCLTSLSSFDYYGLNELTACNDLINFVDNAIANDDYSALFNMRPGFPYIDGHISFVQKNEASSTGWYCWNFDTDSKSECDIQDMSSHYADKEKFDVYYNEPFSLPHIKVIDTIKWVRGKWLVSEPNGEEWHVRFHDDLCGGTLNGYCEFGTCVQSGSTTTCQCPDGWVNKPDNPLSCQEKNECEDKVCGDFRRGGAYCMNAPGKSLESNGYRCRCQWDEKFDPETKQCSPKVFGETKFHSKPFQIYDIDSHRCLTIKTKRYYGDSSFFRWGSEKASVELPTFFELDDCYDDNYNQLFEYTKVNCP